MNEAINANQAVQETEEQRKTRLMMEEVFYKFLFYLASLGNGDDNDFSKLPDSILDNYKKSDQMQGQTQNLITYSIATRFAIVWQHLQLFINKKVCDGVVYESVVSFLDDFFADKEVKEQISSIVKSFLGIVEEYDDSQYKTFTDAFKSLVNEVLARKTFMFGREQLLTYAMMSFYTAPAHILNERWRDILLTEKQILSMLKTENENADEEQTRKNLIAEYKAKAFDMLNNEKPWYSKYAISQHISKRENKYNEVNHLAIVSYLFDELDKLEKTESCNLSLKKSLNFDFAGSHNFENKEINNVVKKYFPAKYYDDRMVACMFDQTLLGQEIDYETLRFWRVVFENTHQEYAESLLLLMNHAADETVRNLFSNNEFRKYVIERQNEIANKIEQLKREIEDLNLAISRNESMAIDPSSTQTPEDKRLNLMLKHENSRLENNISQKKAEIEQLESSLTTFFENLIMTCEMQIEEVKKYYHDEKFESENLFTDFISRQSDPSKKPESFEYLYDLKQNYPNIFCDEEYTWEQKFIVAKALLPMGLDVNNFNARTLERFLGICKTPEEFRVAYLLWENTNFINQFWLMPKITQKDLAAIVEYVGADINNKDKLLERIKEFYNELPAFGEAGYFEKNYSKAKLKESVNELVEKIGKNWSPFAKMHLISNLSGLDRDNLEYIRMLFRCNLGKEKKVLDYVGTVLEMSNGATDRNKCVKELFEDKLLREKILSKVEVCSLGQFKEIHEFSGKLDKNVRNEVAANVSYAQIDKVNELKDKKNLWFALVNKPEYINEYFSLAAAVVKNIKDENNRKSFLDSLKNFTETEKQIVLVDPDSFVNDVCFLYERHDKSEYQEEESEKETTEVSQDKGKSVLQKCDICYILADIRDGKYVSDDDLKFITNRKNVELTVALVKAGKIYLEDLPAEDKFNKLKEILKEAGISEKAPEDEKTQNAITNALLLEVRQ